MKELHLYLYGEIAPDANDPRMYGGPQVFGTNWLVSALNSSNDYTDIVVHINSPGGDVIEGFAIHDILVSTGKKITTIIEGRAASISTVVALAGSVRKITKNSTFFIHNPWQDGYVGDAAHFRKVADGLEMCENVIANFYSEATGHTVDSILPYMAEEKDFTAEEALSMGFVTEIVEAVELRPVDTQAKAYLTNNQNEMSKPNLIERLHAAMQAFKAPVKNADFATADGQTLSITTAGTDPAEGDTVSIGGQPAPDGEYKLADGKTIVVAGSKITAVKPAEAPAPEETPAASAPDQVQVFNTVLENVTTLAETVQNLQGTIQALQKNQTDNVAVIEALTGSVELIGASMQSAGFKKILNKNKFNEDGEPTRQTPETQRENAIKAARSKAGLDKNRDTK